MAPPYYFTNQEAARQNIARMQGEAAMAENQSRERIASENAAAARYATASQLAQRDKEFKTDAEIRREAIASNTGTRTAYAADSVARERANVQYRTILDSISVEDPLTKGELEAKISANPQLSEDLKNNLRAERENAYKIAKANAAAGERVAKNYRAELGGKGVTGKGLDEAERQKVYVRLEKDRNVIFDRASSTVESAFRKPREDGPSPGSGVLRMPGQTIDDVRARITGAPALPPTQSTITTQPSPGFTPRETDFSVPAQQPDYPEYSHVNMPGVGVRMADMPESNYLGTDIRPGTPRVQRSIDLARPTYGPPFTLSDDPTLPRMADLQQPYGPPNRTRIFTSLPVANPNDISDLVRFIQHPNFARLPLADQQSVLDEIQIKQAIPRSYDLNTLRPEYVPMDDRYYAPQ